MRKENRKNSIAHFIFFPAAVFYLELVVRTYCFGSPFGKGFFHTMLFSVAIGLFCALLTSFWGRKANRVLSIIVLLALTIAMGIQTVYYTIFSTFTTLYSITGAGEAVGEFGDQVLSGIVKSLVPLIFLLLPFLYLIVYGGAFTPVKRPVGINLVLTVLVIVTVHVSTLALIKIDNSGIMSARYIYSGTFSPVLSVPRFGVLTTLRLDIQDLLSVKDDVLIPDANESPDDTSGVSESPAGETEPAVAPVTYGKNVMEIDFDTLIANETDPEIVDMHRYFARVKPTEQNEYTGMFENYNLIWIVAEGFSSLALDETHTPTLCKMASEGFVFENFYNPIWFVSTSDGEYVATTGLIPKSGVWSYSRSADNYMPFGFGNMFSKLGYTARAYHNHTYTYYDRDTSFPNMGYIYEGVGNGMEITNQWPESDLEMMEVTVPDYIDEEHFLTYYMTVSGHMNYTFMGNMMAFKHKDEVSDLSYSEGPRAYIACNMEFDQAMEYLIDQLDEAGVLDNTVIVISGDHYPYGLEMSEMEEIAGGSIEQTFELYRSTLMIWNSEMDTVHVDKYCSSLDIMPTLANLFGLDYDSRLVMGRDILSDSDALVIFSDRSFITDYGRYNSSQDTFTVNEG